MKYELLTKEQFEVLHEEFITFLASQQIDKKEWDTIKKTKPSLVQQEMEVFSDFVWERVLNNATYLEHFSEKSINVFNCGTESMYRVVVEIDKETINLLDEKDYKWFLDNSTDSCVHYYKGQKPYFKERNLEIFELVKKGAVIANANLFDAVSKIVSIKK